MDQKGNKDTSQRKCAKFLEEAQKIVHITTVFHILMLKVKKPVEVLNLT
jgi:hypothetical protein